MRKKWINNQDIPTKKKSRAKYDCPKALACLIDMTNRFTDRGGLPDVEFVVNKLKAESLGEYEQLTNDERAILIVEEIIYSPIGLNEPLIKDLVKQAHDQNLEIIRFDKELYLLTPSVCYSFLNIYTATKTDVDIFIKFAQTLNEVRKGIREKHNLGKITFRAIPFISQDNKVVIESNSFFFDAVAGIDADRLRICEICNHIFWAKNKNSNGCSGSCVNALYQRNLRRKNSEEINRQRRKNYYYKNSIPYCEKCIYPVTKCNCNSI